MSRKKATATEAAVSTDPLTVASPQAPASPASPAAPEAQSTGERSFVAEAGRFADIPDPRSKKIASLGEGKNAPKIELLRSHRYNQMQIRSDEPLSDKHQSMLNQDGWADRTEKEGIYTKQLPKEAEKWRETADAERLFTQIANEMRADRGLNNVLGMS